MIFLDESCDDHETKLFFFQVCASTPAALYQNAVGSCCLDFVKPCTPVGAWCSPNLDSARAGAPLISRWVFELCQHCEFCISGKLVNLVIQTVSRSRGFQSDRGAVQIY